MFFRAVLSLAYLPVLSFLDINQSSTTTVTSCGRYMSLYNASAMAVKSVDKSLRIGGPATMQTLDIAGFINATVGANPPIPVDFVSTHFYPTDPQCQVLNLIPWKIIMLFKRHTITCIKCSPVFTTRL